MKFSRAHTERRLSDMLEALRRFDADRANMEEMLALRAFGRAVVNEFANVAIPAPEWLTDTMTRLGREIDNRRRDELEKRLKEIRASRSTLLTVSEKRAALDAEEAELQQQLGIASVAVA